MDARMKTRKMKKSLEPSFTSHGNEKPEGRKEGVGVGPATETTTETVTETATNTATGNTSETTIGAGPGTARVSEGVTLRDACKKLGLSPSTFRRLLREYEGVPGLPGAEVLGPGGEVKKGLIRVEPDGMQVLEEIVRLRQRGKGVNEIKEMMLKGNYEPKDTTQKKSSGVHKVDNNFDVPVPEEALGGIAEAAAAHESGESVPFQRSTGRSGAWADYQGDGHTTDRKGTGKPEGASPESKYGRTGPSGGEVSDRTSSEREGMDLKAAECAATAIVNDATLKGWNLDVMDPARWRLNLKEYTDANPGDLAAHLEHLAKALNRSEERRARDRDRLMTALMRTQQEIQQLRYELIGQRSRRQRKRGFLVRLLG